MRSGSPRGARRGPRVRLPRRIYRTRETPTPSRYHTKRRAFVATDLPPELDTRAGNQVHAGEPVTGAGRAELPMTPTTRRLAGEALPGLTARADAEDERARCSALTNAARFDRQRRQYRQIEE